MLDDRPFIIEMYSQVIDCRAITGFEIRDSRDLPNDISKFTRFNRLPFSMNRIFLLIISHNWEYLSLFLRIYSLCKQWLQ